MSLFPLVLWCLGFLIYCWLFIFLFRRGTLAIFPELALFDRKARLAAFGHASNNRATTIWTLVGITVILTIEFLVLSPLSRVYPNIPQWVAAMIAVWGGPLLLIVLPALLTRSSIRTNLRRELAKRGEPGPGVTQPPLN